MKNLLDKNMKETYRSICIGLQGALCRIRRPSFVTRVYDQVKTRDLNQNERDSGDDVYSTDSASLDIWWANLLA